MTSTHAQSRADLDCADCAFHNQAAHPDECRKCVAQGERTGVWLPLFRAKPVDTGPLETSEDEALPYVVPTGVVPRLTRKPRLIGLTGPARAGKDTVAEYLVRQHDFVQHSFAAPIREFVARILGVTLGELEATKEAPIAWLDGKTPRYLMQTAGTEWGRELIADDLWVRSCLARARQDMDEGRSVVISDVRFDNEAAVIRGLGGKVLRLQRSQAGTRSVHASESGVAPHLVDLTIVNDGTPSDLYHRVATAILRGAL